MLSFIYFFIFKIPQLLPAVMAALADSKTNVRAAAVSTLNTFIKETSLKDLFVNEMISTALTKGNWSGKKSQHFLFSFLLLFSHS